jgi:tetratricopeptide (TPR) repeat protein
VSRAREFARPPARTKMTTLLPFIRRKLSCSFVLLATIGCLAQAQPPSRLQMARQAMDAKHYAEAETLYREALAEAPDSPALLTDLGLSLQMQGRAADAMRYYSLALKHGYVPETHALLAQEKCWMGDFESARPMLGKIFREELRDLRVVSAVAPCYLEIDEPVESATVYESLLKSKEYPADLALVQLAKSYIRSGQFFVGKLSSASGSQPFLAALRQAAAGGAPGARSAFPQAARISPYFKPDLDWDRAVGLWRQHPQDTALLYLLSVLSGEQGMQQIQSCEQQFSASPYLAEFYADMLADQGHGEEAIAQYEQLERDHPDLSELHYNLGLLHEKREEWAAGAAAFERQLDAYPADERAAAHLSRCMLEMEQYAQVRKFLSPQMNSDHPPQWASLNLAEAELKLGDSETAIRILSAAESQPNPDKLVHYRLMQLYSMAGRSADAKREYALFQAASEK